MNEGPGYVLLWATVSKGVNYTVYTDGPEGRQAILADYAQLVQAGTVLYARIFRDDTQAVAALALDERGAQQAPQGLAA